MLLNIDTIEIVRNSIDSICGAVDSVTIAVNEIGMKLDPMDEGGKIFGMDWGTFVMACAAIVAIGVNIVLSCCSRRQHVRELELMRAQKRYSEVNDAGYNMSYYNVSHAIYQLIEKVSCFDDYEFIKRQFNDIYSNFNGKIEKYMYTIQPYDISLSKSVKLDICTISGRINHNLVTILDFINFLNSIDKLNGIVDKQLVQEKIKENSYYIMNDLLKKYCDENDYNIKKIKDRCFVYIEPILENIEEDEKLLRKYYELIIQDEKEKIDVIMKKLKMKYV